MDICADYGGYEVSDAFMWNADRFGFNVLGKNALYNEREEWLDFRIPFSPPIDNLKDCAKALKETFGKK